MSRKLNRHENKKRKLKAYLDLADDNEKDRNQKNLAKMNSQVVVTTELSSDSDSNNNSTHKRNILAAMNDKLDITDQKLLNDLNTKTKKKKRKLAEMNEHVEATSTLSLCIDNNNISKHTNRGLDLTCKNPLNVSNLNGKIKENKVNSTDCIATTKPWLEGEEYMELKKRLNEKRKKKMAYPNFFLLSHGENCLLSKKRKERSKLYIHDIQQIIMYALIEKSCPFKPRWCRLLRTSKISHTVLVMVDGVSLRDFKSAAKFSDMNGLAKQSQNESKVEKENTGNEENFSCVKNADKIYNRKYAPTWLTAVLPRSSPLFPYSFELIAATMYSESAVEELINVPVSKSKMLSLGKDLEFTHEVAEEQGMFFKPMNVYFNIKEEKIKSSKKNIAKKRKVPCVEDAFDRRKLVLNSNDLFINQYPLPLLGSPGYDDLEFKFSKDVYSELTSSSPMYGVDCEMVMNEKGVYELASVSIVNEKLELVYHSLVKPKCKISNYLTKYSGMSFKRLKDVKVTLKDVQADISRFLPTDAILVGHSLDSDLKALKLRHPYCIDSSLVFNMTGRRSFRTGLKKMVKIFFNEDIQMLEGGHDPTEDAASSLKLVQLKLKHDEKFGDVILGGTIPIMDEPLEDLQMHDWLFLHEMMPKGSSYFSSFFSHTAQKHLNCILLATPLGVNSYSSILERASTSVFTTDILPGNKLVCQRTSEVARRYDLTICNLKMDNCIANCLDQSALNHKLRKLDKRLFKMYTNAAEKCLFIVCFTGSGLNVPKEERSNGFVSISLKGLDKDGNISKN